MFYNIRNALQRLIWSLRQSTRKARFSADNPLLAFIHVPKTGGTSLQAVFEGQLMNDRQVFNIHHPDQAAQFLALPTVDQDRHYAVFGHMPFGVDQYINRPVNYITFLRHPVERILSAYGHCLRHPDEPGSADAARMGLAWTTLPSNAAVARLTDHNFLERPDANGLYWIKIPGEVTRRDLKKAKANLRRCAFIGLHEHYEDDIRALSRLGGHRILVPSVLPREKTGPNRVRSSELSEEQIAAIRAANSLDVELYEYALALRKEWGGPVRPDSVRKENWQELTPKWHIGASGSEVSVSFPRRIHTPKEEWNYGAVSECMSLPSRSTVRVTVEGISGRVGVAFLSEDCSSVVSERREIATGLGEESVFLTYPETSRARLCIMNYGEAGEGEVELRAVAFTERG